MDEKTNSTTTPTEEVTEDIAKFNIDTIPFEVDAGTMFIAGSELCERTSSIMKSIFADFDSCQLCINTGTGVPDAVNRTIQPGGLYMNFIFVENSAPGFHMLSRRSEVRDRNSLFARMEFTLGASGRAYVLDQDSLDAMAEFLPPYMVKKAGEPSLGFSKIVGGANTLRNPLEEAKKKREENRAAAASEKKYEDMTDAEKKAYDEKKKKERDAKRPKIDWYSRIFENAVTPQSSMWGFNPGGRIEVTIYGFPVEEVIKVMYGPEDKTDNNAAFSYAVHLMRYSISGNDMVLQVSRMKKRATDKLSKIVGCATPYGAPYQMAMSTGAAPFVRR